MWLIMKTAAAKELHITRLAVAHGIEADCPLDVRSKPVSRHTSRRVVFYAPLIPRIVFLKAPGLQSLPHYALGYARDATGRLLSITDWEYARFRECHQRWLEARKMAHKTGQPGKPRKPVKRQWTPETFMELAQELFGAEMETA